MVKSLARVFGIGAVFILGMWWCLNSVSAATGINRKINFQGKVVNNSGTNVTDGNHNFIFNIYSVASAGTSIWSEVWNAGTTQISVTSGIFSVDLGSQSTFPPTVNFNTDNLYLTLSYEGDTEMSPRIRMAAVPYAMNAERVGGLTASGADATLTIGSSKTVTFGDSFTTLVGVGMTLDQSLSTGSTVSFAGLNIGGSVAFTNIPVSVGTTVLFIASNGTLSKGYLASGVGTTYSFVNGLNNPGTGIVGLGGTLTGNTNIGVSSFSLMFTNSGNIMTIGASGYVGIGTTNPGYKFDVLNPSGTTLAIVARIQNLNAAVNSNGLNINIAAGDTNSYIFNATGNNGTSRLLIRANGNVGIGTTSPNNPLEIFSTTYPQLRLSYSPTLFSTFATDNNGNLSIATTAGNGTGIDIISGINTGQGNNEALTLKTSQTISATDELFQVINNTSQYLTIMGNGSVGIGTTAPKYLFDVNGVGNFVQLGVGGTNNTYSLNVGASGLNVGGTLNVTGMTVLGAGFTANGLSRILSLSVGGSLGVGGTSPFQFSVVGSASTGVAFFYNSFSTTGTAPVVVIKTGIATTGATGGGEFLQFLSSTGAKIGRIRVGTTTNAVAYSTSATADFAEYVIASEPTEAGDLIAFSNNKYIKATSGEPLAGIHSSSPSFIGNEGVSDQPNSFPLAMSGIVRLKVSSINGPISSGDPLTASSIRGVAAKAIGPGSIGAKAIGAYNNADPNQVGMIDVIVNLSWYEPGLDITQQFNFDSLAMTVNDLNTNKISPLVDGLEILTKRIDSLEKNVSELNGQVAGLATSSAVAKTETEMNPIIKFLVEFWNNVLFKGNVAFEKTPVFNNQTAGYAIVNTNDDQADVIFESEYQQMPIVNVSLMVDDNKVSEVLGENYSYTVTNRTTKGFSIKLNKKSKTDLKFAWSVVLVQDAKTYQKPTPTPLSESNPVSPTTEPTIVPTETMLLVTPTIEPTVEPTIFISPTATPGVGESGTIN